VTVAARTDAIGIMGESASRALVEFGVLNENLIK
jgi:hypothetical protein